MTLDILRSDLLSGHRHGFFTRKGGVSSGIYAGLNCGLSSADQQEVVAKNRTRVANAMQIEKENLITCSQVHSNRVVQVTKPFTQTPPKADGMVTNTPGLALGVLTADCLPALFADREAGVVGVAHAGWQGALGGILENTVNEMQALGAQTSRIQVAFGPTISQAAYEVGPEFMDRFLSDDLGNQQFFAGGRGDRVHFDLPRYCLSRVREAGILEADWIGHCTYGDGDRFYSYRRSVHNNEADYGRLISVICPDPKSLVTSREL